VEDHCDALLKIFQKGKLGNFYNIGSNINLKNKDLVKKILKLVKLKVKIGKRVKIKFVKDRPGLDVRYSINSSKINNNINWKSKTNLNEGLKKTILWYLNNISYYSTINKKDILRIKF
jgi:dTDP-glucose 4,6-dehydratase